MENRSYALAAGAFVLLLGLGVVASSLWFGHDTVKTRNYVLASRYAVTGLNPEAQVRYRGVLVGKVTTIDFDPADPRTILIGVSVQDKTPITAGTYGRLELQGVTGLSYVMLEDDGHRPAPLAEGGGARIEVQPSFFDSITASGQDVVRDVDQVAKRVNLLLSDDNQRQLMATLHNLEQASGRLVVLAQALEPTVKALPALAERSTVLVDHGTAVTDGLTNETLPRVNALLDDIQHSAHSLDRLVDRLEQQPHSLIFGRDPAPPGPGEPGFQARGGAK